MKAEIMQTADSEHWQPGKAYAEDYCDDNKTQLSNAKDLQEILDPMNPSTCHPFSTSIPLCGGVSAKRTGWFFGAQVDWKLSDIYSLGAAMYHILTGKRPHERANEIIPITKLGRYETKIVRIIEKSMHQEPSKRYASASQLLLHILNS